MRAKLLLTVTLAPLLAAVLSAPAAAAPEAADPAPAGKAAPKPKRTEKTGLPRPKVEALSPTRTRLTFPAINHQGYQLSQVGETLVLSHQFGGRIAPLSALPRNVLALTSEATVTELQLAPGTRVTTEMRGGRVIVELQDPPAEVRMGETMASLLPQPVLIPVPVPEPAPLPTPSQAAAAPAQNPVPEAPSAAPAAAVPSAPPQPEPPKSSRPTAADVPVPAVPVRPSANPGASPAPLAIEAAAGPAILIPVPAGTGAAAFRSGADLVVVLDQSLALTVPPLRLEAPFQRTATRRTQDATVLTIPQAPPGLRLAQDPRGWLLTTLPATEPPAGIMPQLTDNGADQLSLRLPAGGASRVLVLDEPATGTRLLVGTQTVAGQGILAERALAQFRLLPTLQGIVIAAIADDLRLRRRADGFEVTGGPHMGNTVITSDEARQADAPLAPPASRLFAFTSDTVPNLLARLARQTATAAGAPALGRSEPRIAAAETMVALGMGIEAQGLLDVALADDPALRDKPVVIGLRAVAALLAHRPTEAAALADRRLDGTTEIDLWRGLANAGDRSATPQDARRIGAGLPIMLAYPPPLRDRLLPRALEIMALNGQAAAAEAALHTLPADPALELTRGMVLEAGGHIDEALATYDRVAGLDDRLSRYRAMVRATELRFKAGRLNTTQAAEALDRALYSWRGAQQELELRIRIAELRRQAGQWREAIAVLREGRLAFPDDHEALDRAMAATFDALLIGDAARDMPPASLVALFDQNADVLKSMTWTERNGLPLVDRLTALGLAARAEPVLVQVLAQAREPARRATLGARLANLRIGLTDGSGALKALADTAPPAGLTLEAPVEAARAMLYVRAELARGRQDAALQMLEAINTPDSDTMRADLYGARQAWPQALGALTSLEAKLIPAPADPLSPAQQALVLRLAVAATLANDAPALTRITTAYAAAMEKSPSAPAFRLMTSAPVRGTTDLPRAFDEIKLIQQMKDQIGEVRR